MPKRSNLTRAFSRQGPNCDHLTEATNAAPTPIPAHTSPLLIFQAEEIQANCAEALVNATRNQGVEAAARIHSLGISPLVLMCGSDNLQVSPPLVQGKGGGP